MSARKSAPRMSTGGKPPAKRNVKSSDADTDDTSTRPRRAVKPSAKKLAAADDLEDEPLDGNLMSETESNNSDVQIVEQPLISPATPVRKVKPLPRKKDVKLEEEFPPSSPAMQSNSKNKKKSVKYIEDSDDDPDGIAAPLDKDDDLFPEPSPTKIMVLETPRQGKSNIRQERDSDSPSPNASPKKKQRVLGSKDKGKATKSSNNIGSEEEQSNIAINDDDAGLLALENKTFADVFKPEPSPEIKKDESLPIIKAKTTIVLPDVCEVTEPGLQDPYLLENNFYKDLPNLPGGRDKNPHFYMQPMFPSAQQGGRPNFQGWLLMCPQMKIASAVRPLIFTRSGRFVNPSRIHPGELGIGVIFPEERYELTVDGDTAICVSCAMSKDSFLRTIDTQGQANLSNKYSLLRAKLMAYEWERASSLFTLLLGKGQLYALMKGDANEFQTKSADPKRGTDAPPATVEEDLEEDSVPGFMNTLSTSPSKSAMRSPQKSSAKGPMKVRAMAFEDKVPIYDGRATKFDYNNLDKTEDLGKVFPSYGADQEVPPGSYVVIGYVSQFSKQAQKHKDAEGKWVKGQDYIWKFTPFIQWVIVVGISKKHIRGFTT